MELVNNTINDIAIIDIGLSCATGNQGFALFAAVSTLMCLSRPNAGCGIPNMAGDDEILPLCVENETVMVMSATEKIAAMLFDAFTQSIDKLCASTLTDGLTVYCLIPNQDWPQNNFLDETQAKSNILDCLDSKFGKRVISDNIENINIIVVQDDNSTAQLNIIKQLLTVDPKQTIVFGGVDSFVSSAPCMTLSNQKRILTPETNDGVMPGEAACFVVLKSESEISGSTNTDKKYLALIKSVAVSKEKDKLDTLINESLKSANLINTNIDCIISTMTAEKISLIEWYYAEREVWPKKLSEQQRLAIQLGEQKAPGVMPKTKEIEKLNLNYSLGETGAATLALELALACARFKFEYPKVNTILVCHSGLSDNRGTVILQQ